jgi:hypothetical protein
LGAMYVLAVESLGVMEFRRQDGLETVSAREYQHESINFLSIQSRHTDIQGSWQVDVKLQGARQQILHPLHAAALTNPRQPGKGGCTSPMDPCQHRKTRLRLSNPA